MTAFTRSDICLIDFGATGDLPTPGILMSSDEEIKELETVIVIPLCRTIEEDTLPYRYMIPQRDELEDDSDACIYEIRSLSKTRIKKKLTRLTDEELSIIQAALCEILG